MPFERIPTFKGRLSSRQGLINVNVSLNSDFVWFTGNQIIVAWQSSASSERF